MSKKQFSCSNRVGPLSRVSPFDSSINMYA